MIIASTTAGCAPARKDHAMRCLELFAGKVMPDLPHTPHLVGAR